MVNQGKARNNIWEDIRIDKESPVPAYFQIKNAIQTLMDEGLLPAHTRLPAERELCLLCDVSRMTVRQALSELVKEGYLYREKGRGTFVSPPKITHPMMSLVSFSEDMHQRGMQAGGKTLEAARINHGSKEVLSALYLQEGEPLLRVDRLRYANGSPMVLEQSFFSFNRFETLTQEDLDNRSLYEILKEKYGIFPHRARERIEAGISDEYLGQQLQIGKGCPVLVVTGVSYDAGGQPIEYVKSYYRGDRYQFLVELERRD